MFSFTSLSVFRADCRLQYEAALAHYLCMVMVLFLDSLGQCVSALSKRFAAAESIRDTVNCIPHSHREKHSEVRHRKDTHHQQEDTPKHKVVLTTLAGIFSSVPLDMSSLFAKHCCLPGVCLFVLYLKFFWSLSWIYLSTTELYLMQVTNGKVPTSILKRPSPNYGSDTELNHRRKGERRVRFREPETTVHGETTDGLTVCNKPSLFSHRQSDVFLQQERTYCPLVL